MEKARLYSFMLSLFIDDPEIYPVFDHLVRTGGQVAVSDFAAHYSYGDGRSDLLQRIIPAFPDAGDGLIDLMECCEALLYDAFDRSCGFDIVDAEDIERNVEYSSTAAAEYFLEKRQYENYIY